MDIGSAAPLFIVKSVPAALAFYRDRFGFEITFQGPDPGDIFFGIVQRGGAMIMMKAIGVEPVPNHTRDIKQGIARWDAYIYVPDPDALAEEFAARVPLTEFLDSDTLRVATPQFFDRPKEDAMSYDSTGLFLKLQALLAQHPRLSILEASRLLGVHRHTLSLVIERHGGIVPRTWRDQAALERVWRALRDFPDLPIKAIASTAGFSNGTSLARFTKRVCKMSPSQLRTCNQLPPVAEASAREDG